MRTRLGREIRATGNHQFLTVEGWKRLDGFGADEQIATPRGAGMAGDWKSPPQRMEALRAGRASESAFSRLSRTEAGDSSPRRFDGEGGAWLHDSDIYWDSVISIEPDGEEQVYDLTVPGHHNFVANNIIVHNSLEQDADIVMFIYRPDQYEKDTNKQNVAEIIISKHRNGPVGSVELIFRGALAKFENAATKHVQFNE